jgi:hypothetical protein
LCDKRSRRVICSRFLGEVSFGDEHNVELVRMLEEAIGIPESEAKGVVNYCSFVSTVVRRFNRVPIWSQSCLIMSLRSWMSEVGGRGGVGWGLEWRMEWRCGVSGDLSVRHFRGGVTGS